ncbi:MAG TPA: hypothetical protein VE178_15020 [Silvibacterium sp.]|jgi:hypothetical protein|nr:hypothetical protein [Silvibacterium sp.]
MAEPYRKDDQLTTADLAGTHQGMADDAGLQAVAQSRDLHGPRLVPGDVPNQSISNEAVAFSNEAVAFNDPPEIRGSREWNTSRPTVGSAVPVNSDAFVTPLFTDAEVGDLRSRWSNVQAGFVDEPRHSVEQADQLVATVMQRLAEGFAGERASLEKQWDSGDSVSTEDLRVALQRYRAFFGRLLNAA